LSVDAVQTSDTLLAVVDDAFTPVGADGGVVSGLPPDDVVALTAAEAADVFPAASNALTVYEYAVDAVRPVSVKEVNVVVPT
jgi:hypothetical protein